MARSSECQCTYNFTCGYCLRNMKPYHFTPSKHTHEYKPGKSLDVCECGAFRHREPVDAIVSQELVARWESKLGRYWLELYRHGDGSFSYRGDNSGGHLGVMASTVAAL